MASLQIMQVRKITFVHGCDHLFDIIQLNLLNDRCIDIDNLNKVIHFDSVLIMNDRFFDSTIYPKFN